MRQIKFRQFIGGNINGFHYWGFVDDGQFVGPVTDSSIGAVPWPDSEQFTGLKDSKGVEIYDGDILDFGYSKRYVVWYEGGFWFTENPDMQIESPRVPAFMLFGKIPYPVIGNIYESPAPAKE